MNTLFKVRVRYCGGCNPEIDRGETVEQIEKLLRGRAEFTNDPQVQPDVTLHVCGCAHACLDEENAHTGPEPVVSIQGLRVNRQSTKPEEILSLTSEKLIQAAEKHQGDSS